ncbi:F-box-like and TPR 1 domain containing protein [Trichuris trichiura]|uniref:F-box-like and TPR 1 domain containing protein n=1 Tax=Trichuris trichiura TaxID=36087 RepID=A0A077ZA31_TRITR|nr:F-box-like and TPR 1 domain containing protein [Trichuris trichiura]
MSLISSELATDGTEDSASDSSVRNVRSIEVIDPDNLESASFRWSWRAQFARESRQSPGRPKEQRTDEEKCGNDQKSSSAIRIFEAGIAHEREGRMQQAIRCYKQAIKIYPDVEKMVFLNSSVTTGLSLKAIEESGLATSCRRSPDETGCTSKGEVIKNLEERLSREPKSLQCEPNEPQERTHISALPNEVILQIFRWVISSDLDVQQLEQLSLVCSRFYKLARHPQLWQSICERVWGQQLGPLAPFSSWRDMFINRCRPCFNGLYVAKITYPRMGESNCSSALYRPWHRVVYYRCLRFFPDGTATMITTADPPQAIVQHLKSKKPKCPTAKVGRYTMEKAEVVQVTFNRSLIKDDVYRQTVGSNNFVRNRQFFLVLQVKSTDRLRDNTLVLTNYEAIDHYVCGKTGPSKFRVDERNFPPFHFCPVRSYTALSEAAL